MNSIRLSAGLMAPLVGCAELRLQPAPPLHMPALSEIRLHPRGATHGLVHATAGVSEAADRSREGPDREILMPFGRILIALDHGVAAAHVAQTGFELASRLSADVALVHVVDPALHEAAKLGGHPAHLIVRAMMAGRSLLEQVAKRARLQTSPLEFIPVGPPAAEILQTAMDWEAELLVIGRGPHRSEGTRELGGGVSTALLLRAPCPVVMVRVPEQVPARRALSAVALLAKGGS